MTKAEYFSISTKVIWQDFELGWKLMSPEPMLSPIHKRCLQELWRFLEFKKQVKFISEFREMLGYKKSDSYAIENESRDMARKGICFGSGLSYRVNPEGVNEPIGILVDQVQVPDYNNPEEKKFFKKLFPYRLIQIESDHRDDFLIFHLETTFQNDTKAYKKYLLDSVLADSQNIIGAFSDSLKNWINESLNLQVTSKNKGKKTLPDQEKINSILNDNGKLVVEYVRKFIGKEPVDILTMFAALHKNNLLSKHWKFKGTDKINKAQVRRILKCTFGYIGASQYMYKRFKLLDNERLQSQHPKDYDSLQKIREELKKELERKLVEK